MNRYMMIIMTVALLLCGCDKTKVGQDFLDSNDLTLIVDGKTIHTYDPLTWQVSYSSDRKEFRVFSDTMSDYYVIQCSKLPTEVGQEIQCSLKWSGSSSIVTKNGLNFSVEKISNGKIWLWCRKSKIEVSVMTL